MSSFEGAAYLEANLAKVSQGSSEVRHGGGGSIDLWKLLSVVEVVI